MISVVFCSSRAYNVLKTSISWGVRRLNFRRIPFFMLSRDSKMLLACLNSDGSMLCVCWCVCLSVCLFVGTPSFPMELCEFGRYGLSTCVICVGYV